MQLQLKKTSKHANKIMTTTVKKRVDNWLKPSLNRQVLRLDLKRRLESVFRRLGGREFHSLSAERLKLWPPQLRYFWVKESSHLSNNINEWSLCDFFSSNIYGMLGIVNIKRVDCCIAKHTCHIVFYTPLVFLSCSFK